MKIKGLVFAKFNFVLSEMKADYLQAFILN